MDMKPNKLEEEGQLRESSNDNEKSEDETQPIQFEFDDDLFDVDHNSTPSHQLTPDISDEDESICDSSCTLFKPLCASSMDASSSPCIGDHLERSVSTTDDNAESKQYFNNLHSRNSCKNFSNNNKKMALADIGRSYSVAQDSRSERQRASMLEQLRHRRQLLRDSSFQSDSSHASHCSSIECLLDSRKSDPETILTNLGFKSPKTEDILSRIPKRFLQPSQVRGVNTEEFLQKQHLAKHLHDTSVLGYRGLIGNPDIAPSSIVAKIMERFQINDSSRLKAEYLLNNNNLSHLQHDRPHSAPPTQTTFPQNILANARNIPSNKS